MPMTSNSELSAPQPRRILIVLMGSIGDVVRALPLLGRIRRGYPAAYIAWLVEPKSLPIVAGHRWLDEVMVYDRAAPWSFPLLLRRIRAARFELVLDLQRHLKSGVVSLASGAPERLGFNRANSKEFNYRFNLREIPPQPPMRLKLMQYQAFGDALELPAAPIEFGLEADEAQRVRAAGMLADGPRPLLAVILGSSWPSRLYHPESTAAVIRMLANPADGTPALFPVLIGAREMRRSPAGSSKGWRASRCSISADGRSSAISRPSSRSARRPSVRIAVRCISRQRSDARSCRCGARRRPSARRRGVSPSFRCAAKSRAIHATCAIVRSDRNVCDG